jgi:hypothetical protein
VYNFLGAIPNPHLIVISARQRNLWILTCNTIIGSNFGIHCSLIYLFNSSFFKLHHQKIKIERYFSPCWKRVAMVFAFIFSPALTFGWQLYVNCNTAFVPESVHSGWLPPSYVFCHITYWLYLGFTNICRQHQAYILKIPPNFNRA